jgi:hypothetical protein
MTTPYIQGLLLERAGYVARNLPKRVAEIDALLKQEGVEKKEVKPLETASVENEVETTSAPSVRRKRVADNGSH